MLKKLTLNMTKFASVKKIHTKIILTKINLLELNYLQDFTTVIKKTYFNWYIAKIGN